MKTVKIFDTTLRDGEQAPSCSMHLDEKIEVALALERLKVDVMEAGFAVISQGDFEAVKTIANTVKNSSVASLARAVKKDIEYAYEALKGAVSPRIHTFIATSPIHMQYKLKMTEDEVLERIKEMVSYAKSFISDIEFSAEDATRSDREFLRKAVYTAIKAGATVVNIPDTVGYTTPYEMYDLIRYLKENVENIDKADISVHCHNDLGMAVANSLAAVRAGATQVECTINGLGERAGNAALEEIVMGLNTRKNVYGAQTRVDTTQIYRTSKLVYNVLGLTPPLNKAIVGVNAFAHEAGIHQHGVMAKRETYEIMTPESIGLPQNKMVFGKHSGKHAIENRLKELGYELNKEEMEKFFARFKALADKKKSINDLDLEALVGHKEKDMLAKGYKLDRFTVNSGNYITTNAVVRLTDGKKLYEEVAIGEGPIDAAYKAIDKIIKAPEHSLDDYAIHSISEGKDALGEVVVRIRCGDEIITGRGLSTDIIEASLLAYINGMNKII
ncbi:MAG: 2-isopropylmalate synthase [Bacillota bacterium]|mgnify:CR=1 FL=1|nr:2-isopropylmalate synthase [Bacillota bacterium]HHU43704.1 2-isopropylmalate synthase [Clostridiales bacterium]